MNRIYRLLVAVVVLSCVLSGCAMMTVDQMYCLPKRSESYNNLQSAIDEAMSGLEYCAPLSGENQQTVQEADLDGDGVSEYLLFAKGTGERPLQILVFCQETEDSYALIQTISCNGYAFDQVEYVQMDGQGGCEVVVGRQISDQVLRSVSVFSFTEGDGEQLLTANYTKFLTCDLDSDGNAELMILRPGLSETDNGIAELYNFQSGMAERSAEVSMSEPAENLKRIMTGNLQGDVPAVYVASTVGNDAIITDVYAMVGGKFTNVSLSNESGTSIQTLRSYYVYADDIDGDGIMELPDLVNMVPRSSARSVQQQYLIRWYAMNIYGAETDKMYTFHNFQGGWYLQLDDSLAMRFTVEEESDSSDVVSYSFYLWDEDYTQNEKIMTVFTLTGTNRETAAAEDNRFTLYTGETTIYAARLEAAAAACGISQEILTQAFHMIRTDWKSGET